MTETNPYRRQNRFYKAVKIVDAIEEIGLRLFNLQSMTIKQRVQISAQAGFPAPSEETWDYVIDLFSKRVVRPLVRKVAARSIGSACTPLQLL